MGPASAYLGRYSPLPFPCQTWEKSCLILSGGFLPESASAPVALFSAENRIAYRIRFPILELMYWKLNCQSTLAFGSAANFLVKTYRMRSRLPCLRSLGEVTCFWVHLVTTEVQDSVRFAFVCLNRQER